MKKQLLSVLAAITVSAAVAQTPSPSWPTLQNTAFTNTSVGVKILDAVDQNVVWLIGYDGFAPNANYNWFSRTINGGATYTSGVVFQSTLTPAIGDTTTFAISNMEGIDANTAWVCAYKKNFAGGTGSGGLFKTTNGGVNWTNVTPLAMYTNTASFANFVTFLTPSVGIANGDPVNGEFELWRTLNGGISWTQVPGANIPNPLAQGEYAITNLYAKFGNSNVWFGTNQGRMFRTTDAGLTWNVSTVAASTTTLIQIAFASPLRGIAYAINNSATFEEYTTADGGATWNQVATVDPNLGKSDVVGIPGTSYFASCASLAGGNGLLSYSTDNGITWIDWGSTGIQYLTLDFASGSAGWAGSFSDNNTPGVGGIWKYTGATLTSTTVPTANFTLPYYLCSASPSTVTPVNNSTGSATLSYSWTVSAGATLSSPTASAPLITFSGNNTYTVTLTATNSLGNNTSSQVIQVFACSAPTSSFSLPASGCNNVAITTTNSTTGNPVSSSSWSASPSTGVTFLPSSSVMSPSINFSVPGTYTITLTSNNGTGTNSISHTVTINNCAPVASFTLGSVADGCADVNSVATATAASNSTGTGPLTYTWNISPITGVNVYNYGPLAKNFEFSLPGVYTVTLTVGNISGTSTAVKSVTASICTGVAENSSILNNLSVYPNPAHDQLNISLPANTDTYKIKMMNVIGAVVFEEKAVRSSKDVYTINLANKAKGVYFLTVEANGEKAVKKIVVE